MDKLQRSITGGLTTQEGGALDLQTEARKMKSFCIGINFANEGVNCNVIVTYGSAQKIIAPGASFEIAVQIPGVYDGSKYVYRFETINAAAAVLQRLTITTQSIQQE